MKELEYPPCARYCCRCIGRTRVGKILRTLVIVSNVLYWFTGCAILSVAIWLRFVDVGTKNFFSTFHPVDTALYVVLVASVLFLVASFVGTCAANTKNELMISLYIMVVFVVCVAEIISLTVYSSSHYQIERDFSKWFKGHFERYQDPETIHKEVVNHVQSKMKCCGMSGHRDYLVVFGNESIPNSCIIQLKIAENIFRPEVYKTGCMNKLNELILWLLKGWPLPFTATIILLLQVAGMTTSALLLQHIVYRKNFNYDEDNDESSGLIDPSTNVNYLSNHSSNLFGKLSVEDLPRPKLYRVVKSPIDLSYGFDIGFNKDRNCYVIADIQHDSNAEYAGLTVGSQIMEINGMLLQGVDQDEVYDMMERATNEMLLVGVDEKTETVYRANKVAVNLKNVEGVTNDKIEYKPRLCKLKKESQGFGFHLLYLEDRKGEYIEDVAPGSPAYEAGLSIGDRIIDVNGVNIEREKSSDVVKRIRMSGDVVSLLVVDPKTDGYYRKKGVTLSASLALDYFIGRTSSLATPRTQKRKSPHDVKPRYCRLVKSEKEDFGLYVVIDNNRIGQVIRWVDCGGPADRAGLRIGDRIIEVNGHSVEYESHQRLINCISINKTLSHFIVVDEEYDRVYKRNKPRLCRIFKESGSLGFCVCFAQNKDGHYVEEVESGGPAERAGLRVGDRIVQLDGTNVEKESHQNVLNRLRACDSDVVLLVIDSRANKHYKRIVQFKSQGMKDVDYDTVSIPEEPLFVKEEEDDEYYASESISLGMNDSVSLRGSQSQKSDVVTLLRESTTAVTTDRHGCRECTVRMARHEKQGFELFVDRDRDGLVVKNLEKGGPGDRGGLKDGDRITSVNGEKISNLTYDEVLDKIQQCGRKFCLAAVDKRSDDINIKNRPYIFRIIKDEGGYGFFLWHDENGHYVEEVTIGSPADRAGMRSGDRIIEVNGVNVEEETHEEVFYRVKASMNVVTLLAVDQKTFRLYKKHKIPVSVLKAESNFSADSLRQPGSTKKSSKVVNREIELVREKGGDFGFNLAFSNSFIGSSSTGSHVVHWVETGGPAYVAGLRDGDKIVAVEGADVRNEDQDQVIERIYQVGKQDIILTIEYEEEQDAYLPHSVTIKKIDNSFGFHLWFDQNGHYIEDVTIGSASDLAGLKKGDRVLKVNDRDVEEDSHADVVALVRKSGEEVSLVVLSVQNEDISDFATPTVCTLMKEKGTFGFTISHDDKGFHFDYVAPFSPAEKVGILVGDRLLEINGETVSGVAFSAVVSAIRQSGSTVTLTVISSGKGNNRQLGESYDSFSNQIFNELRGKDKIDYVVERTGFELYGRENKGLVEKNTKDIASNAGRQSYGTVNPAFTNDKEEITLVPPLDDLMAKDVKGRFLDEKLLPKATSHATMRRRRPGRNIYARHRVFAKPKPDTERRKRNLIDIEQKLTHTMKSSKPRSDRERVTYMKNLSERNDKTGKSQKERHFRLVTSKSSLRQTWNFEQSDSRRPGEIKRVCVGDDVIEEVDESEDTPNNPVANEESINRESTSSYETKMHQPKTNFSPEHPDTSEKDNSNRNFKLETSFGGPCEGDATEEVKEEEIQKKTDETPTVSDDENHNADKSETSFAKEAENLLQDKIHEEGEIIV